MLTGDGSGENFTGILEHQRHSDAELRYPIFRDHAAAPVHQVRVTPAPRQPPTLHPKRLGDIDLRKDNEGRYFFGEPGAGHAAPVGAAGS